MANISRKELIGELNKGKKPGQIADKFNKSVQWIYQLMREYKIEKRWY